jgi:hypothetical protein
VLKLEIKIDIWITGYLIRYAFLWYFIKIEILFCQQLKFFIQFEFRAHDLNLVYKNLRGNR